MIKSTEIKLEKMRETVDEKLHKTLEDRLGKSFEVVTQQLLKVFTNWSAHSRFDSERFQRIRESLLARQEITKDAQDFYSHKVQPMLGGFDRLNVKSKDRVAINKPELVDIMNLEMENEIKKSLKDFEKVIVSTGALKKKEFLKKIFTYL